MGGGILVVYFFPRKYKGLLHKLKFGKLIEEPPKPKEEIRNPDFFSPGGPKLGVESSFVCLCKKKPKPLLGEVEN